VKRAFRRRLGWLIILPTLKPACAIHPGRLSHAPDNACPTENFSCLARAARTFRIVPAAGERRRLACRFWRLAENTLTTFAVVMVIFKSPSPTISAGGRGVSLASRFLHGYT
jgi:hypothetical protein